MREVCVCVCGCVCVGVCVCESAPEGITQRMWTSEPDSWEKVIHEAEVIALFKKGKRESLHNYRDICLLQVISRLLERVATKRLPHIWKKKKSCRSSNSVSATIGQRWMCCT